MKWLLPVLLLAVCIVTLTAADLSSADDVQWSYDAAPRELTVMSDVPDYGASDTRPWESVVGQAVAIRISEGVSALGDRAFSGASSLQSVSLPGSLTQIGDCCFSGCTDLQSVTLSPGIVSLGTRAFADCSKLVTVTLDGSPACGAGVFDGAGSSVGGIDIICLAPSVPDGMFSPSEGRTVTVHSMDLRYVQTLGASAFRNVQAASVEIPISVGSIGDFAFAGSSMQRISVAGSPVMGRGVFSGCTSVTAADIVNMAAIPEAMFDGCTSLSSVSMSGRISAVADAAFRQTAITEIVFPGTLKNIGEESFSGCTLLTHAAFTDAVNRIGDRAFMGCTSLRTVELQSVSYPGSDVFSGCTSVERSYSPDGAFDFQPSCRVYTEFTNGPDVMVKYDFGSAGGGCVLFSDTVMGSSMISGSQGRSFRCWANGDGNRVTNASLLTESTVLYAQWNHEDEGGFDVLGAALAAASAVCALAAAAVCLKRD